MALIVATLACWTGRLLDAREALRVRRAERAITRFLDLLGGSSISSEVRQRLIADYLAKKPLALHASQLGPVTETDYC
jgi:hypothetical protein